MGWAAVIEMLSGFIFGYLSCPDLEKDSLDVCIFMKLIFLCKPNEGEG